MNSTRREDVRHEIGRYVAPGPLVGTTEGFTVVDLSAGGMSLVRRAPTSTDVRDKKGLDLRFAWLSVPLPGKNAEFCALIEILHRTRDGALERIGARFEDMSTSDCAALLDYLDTREGVSSGGVELVVAAQ